MEEPGIIDSIQPKVPAMTSPADGTVTPTVALELFQPNPDALYGLDAAAYLAGVSRRVILVYCCAGLVQPVLQPPYGVMAFTGDAIHSVRRIECFRRAYGLDLGWIKTMLDLVQERDRLLAELRFLRRI